MNAILTIVLLFAAPGEAKPAWVDSQPRLQDGIYQMEIVLGPESTREECEKQALPAVRSAAEKYAKLWSASAGYDSPLLPTTSLSDDELTKRVIGEKWEEHVNNNGTDRIFLHVQLKFDARLQDEWRRAAQEWKSERRVLILVAGFLLAMWGVAVVHVGLRVDAKIVGRTPRRTKAVRAVLWTTAAILTAIPVLVVS